MRASEVDAGPPLALGPLLAWSAVLLTSLISLLLLAYVASTGTPPWPAPPRGNPWLTNLSLALSVAGPAALVLAGAFLATRLGSVPAAPVGSWTAPAPPARTAGR
jgi:hypothetical protein